MSGSLNEVRLIGNVGKDPEIKSSSSGKFANFSIATTESWRDKQTGEKKQQTEWHRVSVFNEGLVGVIEKYVSKGSKIYLAGKLRTRKYQKDGQDMYTTEVVLSNFDGKLILLGGKGGGDQDDGHSPDRGDQTKPSQKSYSRDLDDEVPF